MVAGVLGWVGVTGTFVAYALLNQGLLRPDSIKYALLNVVGGLLAGGAAVAYGAWPSAASNAVWAAMGSYTLAKLLWRRRTARGWRSTSGQPSARGGVAGVRRPRMVGASTTVDS